MSGEYMIRWKRTAKNKWYYAPKVYTNRDEAYSYANMCNRAKFGQRGPYRIEVVQLEVTVVWEGKDDTVQEPTLEPTLQADG